MKYCVGVDLGGTNIAAAVCSGSGQILSRSNVRTCLPQTPDNIVRRICTAILDAVKASSIPFDSIYGVGIGTPGIAVHETGVVEYSCNLGFYNFPIAQKVCKSLDKPVFIENDANTAALGEYLFGAGRGYKNIVTVTLGTGVGAGVIIDGKLLHGSNFAGSEIGHMVIEHNGIPCNCGRRGCFEAYSSATALRRMTKEAMLRSTGPGSSSIWQLVDGDISNISGRTAFLAAKQGNPIGTEIVDRYISYLGCGLTNIINIFQPELLCIGGGVSNEGDALLLPLRTIIDGEDYAKNSAKRCRVVISELGNDAGIIGAAMLCFM